MKPFCLLNTFEAPKTLKNPRNCNLFELRKILNSTFNLRIQRWLRTVDELQLTKSYQDNFKNMSKPSKREQNNLQDKAGVAKMHATMFIL